MLQSRDNYRLTRQRKVILEELKKVYTHPGADEIYEMVRKRLPRISLGTVYRNLEILSELGEIQKLELGGTLKRFDAETKLHYHVRCIRCERLDDAHIQPLKEIETDFQNMSDYKITGHMLIFNGICPDCQASVD